MATFSRIVWVLALTVLAQVQGSARQDVNLWNMIESLVEQGTPHGNPQLVEYLQSLTAEEMLTAARQGCDAGVNKPKLTLEWERAAAAGSNALLCLEYYFDKSDTIDADAIRLLDIARDTQESPWLRRAIIVRMAGGSEGSRFANKFHPYVAAHVPEVDAILSKIIAGKRENALLRREAMDALGSVLRNQVRVVWNSDPDVRQAIMEKRKHTNKVVRVSELIRSGEVTLTENTIKTLKPIEERLRAYVKLLGAILADTDNEPEDLRKHATRKLETYLSSALTGIDDDVEKALQEPTG